MLNNKKIILGITGGIAAYKSADLARRLIDAGAQVQVVMTDAAQEFITPLTLQAVSGNPVRHTLLDPNAEAAMGHIELARWADAILVAPASANFIAKLTQGRAEDLLTTLCLAKQAETPIAIAPAMNQRMWHNIATQENVHCLQKRGVKIFGPAEGEQACGDVGPGRMLEPLALVEKLSALFQNGELQNTKILITAGPTREAIDPVRYLGNHSSGKMGFALAQAAIEAGAQVTLIAGPVHLTTPENVTRIDVNTALEMQTAVMEHINTQDIFIGSAAVADYRPAEIAPQKLKKENAELQLQLIKNPDIISCVADLSSPPFTVGFAAETQNLIKNAKIKLKNKKLNMLAANDVSSDEAGFNSDNNALTLLWDGGQQELGLANKSQIARQLIHLIAEKYHDNS